MYGLFILLRKSWEDCLYLMSKVNTMTISAGTFETWLHLGWFLSLPTQWYAEIFQARQMHIATFLWYRLPIFWYSRSLIPYSGRRLNSHQDVHLNICMLTPPKPGNDHAHGLELRIGSEGCVVDATVTIYRNIWESGAWMVVHRKRIFRGMYKQAFQEWNSDFMTIQNSELLQCSSSEWTDNSKNRGQNLIIQVTLTYHAISDCNQWWYKSEFSRAQRYLTITDWDQPSG